MLVTGFENDTLNQGKNNYWPSWNIRG